jgi:sugar phosphate isomerase/epimerase
MTQRHVARRQFLKTGGLGALAAAGLGALGSKTAEAAFASATTDNSSMPRLFSGCCAYSYNKELRRGQMTLEDFIHKAVDLRVDAVDMTVYYLKSTEPAYLEGLRYLAYRNAVAFSGAACGVTMVNSDPAKRSDALNEIKKWVDVTDTLGASHLRVFAGALPPGVTMAQAVDWVVETMRAATDYSGKKGIMLGIEDHQGVSQSADVCLEIMHRVASPYAGINLDVTHFIPTATQDAYAQIAACIPYATNTHIRDQFDDHTPIDMDRLFQLFVRAGFKGYMSAEYESRPGANTDSGTAVPKLVSEIQALCWKYSSTGFPASQG